MRTVHVNHSEYMTCIHMEDEKATVKVIANDGYIELNIGEYLPHFDEGSAEVAIYMTPKQFQELKDTLAPAPEMWLVEAPCGRIGTKSLMGIFRTEDEARGYIATWQSRFMASHATVYRSRFRVAGTDF